MTPEQENDLARFRAIVERGGIVTCAPDVAQLFASQLAESGVQITVSTHLPSGWIVAMDKAAPIEYQMRWEE